MTSLANTTTCPNPECGRLSDDFAGCGKAATCAIRLGGDPKPLPMDGSVVVLGCSRCEVRLAVPVARLLSGRPWQPSMRCSCGETASRAYAMVPRIEDALKVTNPASPTRKPRKGADTKPPFSGTAAAPPAGDADKDGPAGK